VLIADGFGHSRDTGGIIFLIQIDVIEFVVV
jgi:hypothetical protein